MQLPGEVRLAGGNTIPGTQFGEVCRSLVWCTYKRGMAKIGREESTSDAQWGCVYRSAQMALANAIVRSLLLPFRSTPPLHCRCDPVALHEWFWVPIG